MNKTNNDYISAFDIVFPVFGGKMDEKGHFIPHEIYGTAFYIKNNFFVTCAHTILNAKQHETIALAYQIEKGSNKIRYAIVANTEVFEKNDSGILHAKIDHAIAYPWKKNKLSMLHDILSFGYPYGYDRDNKEILVRSFKGHISMVGHNYNFHKSPHYELSYQIPKGLSGAPLIFMQDGMKVCGISVGNEITEIVVNTFKEKDQEGDKLVIYEKTEALHRGIVLQVESFEDINSILLGATFFEYLQNNNLLF